MRAGTGRREEIQMGNHKSAKAGAAKTRLNGIPAGRDDDRAARCAGRSGQRQSKEGKGYTKAKVETAREIGNAESLSPKSASCRQEDTSAGCRSPQGKNQS